MDAEEQGLWNLLKQRARRELTEYGALNYGRVVEVFLNSLPAEQRLVKLRAIAVDGFPLPEIVKKELEAGGVKRMKMRVD